MVNEIYNEILKMKNYKNILTKEFLIKEYIDNGKSTYDISKEINIPQQRIWKYLKKYFISIQNYRNLDRHKKDCQCSFCKTKRGEIFPYEGKIQSERTRKKISIAKKEYYKTHSSKLKGIKLSQTIKNKISIGVKKSNSIHHLDGNHNNNSPENKIIIPTTLSSKIHYDAYKFLVEKGLLNEYLQKFQVKYNIKIIKE